MDKFNSDESVSYSASWEDDVFSKTFATKPHKDSEVKFVGTWTLDFSGCTERATREYAASKAVIDRQNKFRSACKRKELPLTEQQRLDFDTFIDMSSEMAKVRKAADPLLAARKQKDRMTRDQKLALMAELQADLGDDS